MIPLLLVALAVLQERPAILDVRTITGGHARSGCWLPLKVRVGGPVGFEGEITATADAGFRVTRPFKIGEGGGVDLLLPVVVLGASAKVDVILGGPAGEIDRRALAEPLVFLDRERLVLLDARHPEAGSLRGQKIALADGSPVVFAGSDPADWNDAADMGALEAVDAVVPSAEKAVDLTMTVWRALGGVLTTQPTSDLVERLREPAARFPAVDPAVARFTVSDSWISRRRDSALFFIVVYGFAFFVVVYVTVTRKGGPWMLMGSAGGIAIVFVAAFMAFFPKGAVAVRAWQGIVDAPEAPVAITICALWGTGPAADVEFGRIVKPVHASLRDSTRRDLELRLGEGGRWTIRGTAPGDSTRFVTVERLQPIAPWTATLDPEGRPRTYNPAESGYYFRVPRKSAIRLQDPETLAVPPIRTAGLIETAAARVFRVEIRK